MTNIVFVEDDEEFAVEMSEFLETHGMRVSWIQSLHELSAEIAQIHPDLVVLDQFVNGHDCLTVLSELRSGYAGGVVVLTGNREPIDRIVALETGADDFVAKSLGPRELLARIRAVLRRVRPDPAQAGVANPVAGAWRIDQHRKTVQAPNGVPLRLTGLEFEALVFLSQNVGRVISRDELSITLLRRRFTPLDRSVDNLLSRLRKAIEPHLAGDPVIRSVRGRGYVFSGLDAPSLS